ncbi:MAG: TraB/GumN family protein [Luteolibacter sp.]
MSSVARIFSFLMVCVVASPSLHAEEAVEHPIKPFLWEVSGNGLKVPSYLFGTIHLGDKRVTTMHPAVERAFGKSEVVLTEVPLDMASQIAIAPKMMRSDGKTLDEAIGEELAERVNEELAILNPALDSTPFQAFSTWVMATMIPMLPDQFAGRPALDKILWDRAEKEGKRTGAMETMEGQVAIFTEMNEAEQVIYLTETLKTMKEDREAGRDTIEDMKLSYVSGEVEKVQAVLEHGLGKMKESGHEELAKAFKKRIFTDRDKSMAKTIDETLKSEPGVVHFFAAGAGHFSSETSIRSHLEKVGYSVTRVLE